MPPQLPANKLLLQCSRPLDLHGKESAEGLFTFAANTVTKVLLKEENPAYDKLKLPVYYGIFCGRRTIAEITRKKYKNATEPLLAKLMPCVLLHLLIKGKPLFIYKITDKGLTPPQQITAELSDAHGFEKQAAALQKSAAKRRLSPFGLKRRSRDLSLKLSISYMNLAAKDMRFISRFNEETFFRGLSEQSFASPLIDLSDKQVRTGFAALYAMTYYGLSDSDLFTVDGVFGFTDMGVRSKDDIRQQAAAAIAAKLSRNDSSELAEMAEKMGASLLELPLPPVDPDDPITLAKNAPFYAGCALMGNAYLTALPPLEAALAPDVIGNYYQTAKQRAKLLTKYANVLILCQRILTLTTANKSRISDLEGYQQTKLLQLTLDRTK